MKALQALCLTWAFLASLPAGAQTISLVSDLNGRYGSTDYHDRVTAAVAGIVELQPDLVISAGDMVAGQKQPLLDAAHLERMWQGFNDTVSDPLAEAGIPLAVTAGNHDGSGFTEFRLEQEHFARQWNGRHAGLEILPGSEWPRRYAARVGGILLLSFDGTIPGKLPAAEYGFVAAMLAEYAASAQAIIVFSHLPMWPFAKGREKEVLDDPDLLALLHRFDVDVYASGHHHLFYAATDEAGMLHLAVGALGGNARAFSTSTARQPHSMAELTFDKGSLRVRALFAPGFAQELDINSLPPWIDGPLGRLTRLDSATGEQQ